MSVLISDCISHVLQFCPLNELTSVSLVNTTWHAGLTQTVWHVHARHHLGKEMTNAKKLHEKSVKFYRKLFGDDHPQVENLLLFDEELQNVKKEKKAKKMSTVQPQNTRTSKRDVKKKSSRQSNREKKVKEKPIIVEEKQIVKISHKTKPLKPFDYHKTLKGYVIGQLRRREGEELKKLIRFPLQLVFGEGDGRKIDRTVAFERKWKKVNEFLNASVSSIQNEQKKNRISNSIINMFIKRVKYDLNLVFKKNPQSSFELSRKICSEISSGQFLKRFRISEFLETFYQYFDSSIAISDQVELLRESREISMENFNSFTFDSFKVFLDFVAKYCPSQVQSIRNDIEKDQSKDESLKQFLFEKPQRLLGHYLIGKSGMQLFGQISDGFEYCLEEYRMVIPNFVVECLIFSERLDSKFTADSAKRLKMVETYAKFHKINYLNLDYIVQILNRSNEERHYKKHETAKLVESLLTKIKDDPKLPLIFRITTCKFSSWSSDNLLLLMEILVKYSTKVFDENIEPPYRDPLVFIANHLQSAYGTYSSEKAWVNLFLDFLNKGSRKWFVDKISGRSFAEIVKAKIFPSSVRYILVDYLDDYE